MLPIALLRVHVTPRSGLRPCLTTAILLGEDVNQALRYIINLGQVQKAIQDDVHKALPVSTENTEKGAVPSLHSLDLFFGTE